MQTNKRSAITGSAWRSSRHSNGAHGFVLNIFETPRLAMSATSLYSKLHP
ncbi:uncharacterized protein PHALS_10266 [Plasmopara halstedii]|uniref:Uncharacterized protein n=1 Tax=Plasmopara halstedii TaxID=4781 RepID=A0A0P1AGX6_PLAHL|nr:uncharacterized protein PHALS_10266 [Plasmopara halstedii]CEG40044.1 hypothetical protein PHALS_10266 [Plasmopara halstedii]|eukprot:XP_024576413.1 hypothetical protein PHALS_10266 [Plasmopara halstedii]